MTLLQSEQKLEIGDRAPSFRLKGVDRKIHAVCEIDGPILIVFICNHCPYVIPKVERLSAIQDGFNHLTVVGINSNNNPKYPEDNFENMQEFAKEHNISFKYLFDEDQSVATSYGAVCTPDPFLFDQDHKLFYHGRLDDALSPGQHPNHLEMEDQIQKMFDGQEPADEFKPSQGCSIKWVR